MSAYEIPGLRFSIPAGAAIVQHRFVSVNANGQAIQATASTPVIGVSMNEVTATDELPAAKQIAEIADGIVMVEAFTVKPVPSSFWNGKSLIYSSILIAFRYATDIEHAIFAFLTCQTTRRITC